VGGLNPSTPISKVTNFLPFCTIGISWSVSDRQTDDRWITLFTPGYISSFIPISRNLTPSLSYIVRKRIAKVTDFLSFCPFGMSIFPFLTIGISSMYQKHILPYFIIPSTFSPQASSPLERYRQTDRRTDGQHSSPPVT